MDQLRDICYIMGFSGMLTYYTDAILGYGYGNGIMYALPPPDSSSQYHPPYSPPHVFDAYEHLLESTYPVPHCDPLTAVSLYCLPSKF